MQAKGKDAELVAAVQARNVERTRELLEAGADVNARNWLSSSVLMEAACARTPELLELVLRHGPDLHQVNSSHFTALHMAVQNKCFGVAQRLIEAGADIDFQQNVASSAPLHLAIHADAKGGLERIEFLLSRGASDKVMILHNQETRSITDYARQFNYARAEEICDFISGWPARQARLKQERDALTGKARALRQGFRLGR